MRFDLLEEIGLTKSEIKVYNALLELGISSTGKIVEKSKASSSKIYEILDKLMQKGLVSFIIKSGVKHFEAAPPSRLLDYMKEREKKVQQQTEALKKIVPELELKRTLGKYQSEATIYKGMRGLETAFYDAMNLMTKDDEMLAIGVPRRSDAVNRFFVKFGKARSKRKIRMRILFNEEARGQPQTLPENNWLTKIKYMPESTPSAINILKDRVIIFPETPEPLLIVIDNPQTAESFRVQFEKWWNQKVQTFEGQEAVERAYNSLLDSKAKQVAIFAARPNTKHGADFNLEWSKEMCSRVKRFRLLYYGDNATNKKRAVEFNEIGCETKILTTQQSLPISTVVVDDVILNSVWGKKPITFKMENKVVAESLRANFELLWEQNATVQKGMDALRDALLTCINSVETGGTYDILGAAYGPKKLENKFDKFFRNIHRKRSAKGVQARMLFNPSAAELALKHKKGRFKDATLKFLPYDMESPVEIFTAGEKTFITTQEEEPTVITINNKQVTEMFKQQFETLWNQETRVLKGIDAVQNMFEEMLRTGHADFIGARGYFVDKRPNFIKDWAKRAKKLGFTMRNIVDPETKGHPITQFPFTKTKYTLQKEFSVLSVFWIFANKVVISNWGDDEPTVIVIENQKIHDLYKQQFELLWKQ